MFAFITSLGGSLLRWTLLVIASVRFECASIPAPSFSFYIPFPFIPLPPPSHISSPFLPTCLRILALPLAVLHGAHSLAPQSTRPLRRSQHCLISPLLDNAACEPHIYALAAPLCVHATPFHTHPLDTTSTRTIPRRALPRSHSTPATSPTTQCYPARSLCARIHQ
ncbi:hypothetical protein B0H13DRAFT_2364021 [Mycena leptocephala]|nr:hypothetical protein B0H13DRAFT_2364021 [Mycena leptocephala]